MANRNTNSFEYKHKDSLKEFRTLSEKSGNIDRQKSEEGYNSYKQFAIKHLPEMITSLRALKKGSKDVRPADITLGEYAEKLYGIKAPASRSAYSFLESIGIDTSSTIAQLYNEQSDIRKAAEWLVPEIVVDAIRMGIDSSVMNELVANTFPVSGLDINIPSVSMGDFQPKILGEGERIPIGKLTFGQRKVNIEKFGIGVSITDEVRDYVPINMLALHLRNVGRWFNLADSAFLVETLLNGEQAGGTYAAPLIGAKTPNTLTYTDMNKVLVRMANLEMPVTHILSNEETWLTYSELDELTGKGYDGEPRLRLSNNPQQTLTGIPHGLIPAKTLLMLNAATAISRMVAKELMTEEERVSSTQLTNIYVTKSIGFAKNFRDAVVKLDYSQDVAANDFPSYMDIEALQAKGYRRTYGA